MTDAGQPFFLPVSGPHLVFYHLGDVNGQPHFEKVSLLGLSAKINV